MPPGAVLAAVRPMRTLLVLTLVTLPVLATAHADDPIEGVVPLGSGGAYAHGVDHVRHAIPHDAVGIAVVDGSAADFGLVLGDCPPNMACTQVLGPEPCLAAFADVGEAAVPYAFRWAFEPADATHLLEELPRFPTHERWPACDASIGPQPAR